MFDTEFLRNTCSDLTNFGLEFLGPRMALADSQDVQGGQGLPTLAPPGHPEAAPGAAFEIV